MDDEKIRAASLALTNALPTGRESRLRAAVAGPLMSLPPSIPRGSKMSCCRSVIVTADLAVAAARCGSRQCVRV